VAAITMVVLRACTAGEVVAELTTPGLPTMQSVLIAVCSEVVGKVYGIFCCIGGCS